MDVDKWCRVLSLYDGRDRIIRALAYVLPIVSERVDPEVGKQLLLLAQQLSGSRLVFRQLNDLPMVKVTKDILGQTPQKLGSDWLVYYCDVIVDMLYTFYHPVEHVAWLSNFQIIRVTGQKWWDACTALWAMALIFTILRSIRQYKVLAEKIRVARGEADRAAVRKMSGEQVLELLSVLQYTCDLMNAIHYLPAGFLWAQKLTRFKSGVFGVVASLVGLYKVYRRC